LVASTDRAFTFATGQGGLAAFVRTRLAPIVLPTIFNLQAMRRFAFRTVSQTQINYRSGPLSRGSAGRVQGGDRLPWVAVDGADNFAPLPRPDWQVHVYGEVKGELAAWCSQRNLPLQMFAWNPEHEAAGLARNALYLLRPDTYVALADPGASPAALEQYFRDTNIQLAP
jgi:hypothetical protein